MTIKIGVVMDPIEEIYFSKNTTLELMLEAQDRGWQLFYMQPKDLFLKDSIACAEMQHITVHNDPNHWFDFGEKITQPLQTLDAILMRKDPPFNMEYIYTTYLLELAEKQGVIVINKPQSLRDANEKMFINWFPQCCPPSLVTAKIALLRDFMQEHQEIVVKPLDVMGGTSVFYLRQGDRNVPSILETITAMENNFVMAQKFISEIFSEGDNRIILINGEPVPYRFVRVPIATDFRGNTITGATSHVEDITEKQRWICQQIGPVLREKGLHYVGIDIIGNYLTEINVTSPAENRSIKAKKGFNVAAELMNWLKTEIEKKSKK